VLFCHVVFYKRINDDDDDDDDDVEWNVKLY